MSDDVLKFDNYDGPPEGDDRLVRCARCSKWIPGTNIRCPACRVHFQGEARDFYHPSEQASGGFRKAWWFGIIAIILVISLFIGALGR